MLTRLRPLRSRSSLIAALMLAALSSFASATVTVALGPVYNPATGSRYYRIEGGTWDQLRVFAQQMGGDLCTISNAAENTWVWTNVLTDGSKAYIGLNDAQAEGTLVWADSSSSAYRNWRAGEPTNSSTRDYVRFDGTPQATWEMATASISPVAVVEISGAIRVPQEIPTIEAACAWPDAPRFGTILIAPGSYMLSSSITVTGVTLRGAGVGVTNLIGSGDPTKRNLALKAGAALEDLTFQSTGGQGVIDVLADPKQCFIRRCDLAGFRGDPIWRAIVTVRDGAAVTIENSTLRDSGGMAVLPGNSVLQLVNCVVRDVNALRLSTEFRASLRITNSLLTRISSPFELFDDFFDVRLANSIVWNCASPFGPTKSSPSNCILPAGVGDASNISADPRWVDPASNDFRLQPDSPAIDAGAITAFLAAGPSDFADLVNQPRVADVNGAPDVSPLGPIDIGPTEFQPNACTADLNGDGQVDDIDFVLFAIQYNQFLCP